MIPEQMDEATSEEIMTDKELDEVLIQCLIDRGWKPPEPVVNPDVLAARSWMLDSNGWALGYRQAIIAGKWDRTSTVKAYLAGAMRAREQERKRAKVLQLKGHEAATRLLELASDNDFDEGVGENGVTVGMVIRDEIARLANNLRAANAKYEEGLK